MIGDLIFHERTDLGVVVTLMKSPLAFGGKLYQSALRVGKRCVLIVFSSIICVGVGCIVCTFKTSLRKKNHKKVSNQNRRSCQRTSTHIKEYSILLNSVVWWLRVSKRQTQRLLSRFGYFLSQDVPPRTPNKQRLPQSEPWVFPFYRCELFNVSTGPSTPRLRKFRYWTELCTTVRVLLVPLVLSAYVHVPAFSDGRSSSFDISILKIRNHTIDYNLVSFLLQ
jgi:hypothetical protein